MGRGEKETVPVLLGMNVGTTTRLTGLWGRSTDARGGRYSGTPNGRCNLPPRRAVPPPTHPVSLLSSRPEEPKLSKGEVQETR